MFLEFSRRTYMFSYLCFVASWVGRFHSHLALVFSKWIGCAGNSLGLENGDVISIDDVSVY